jgi:hypothetical protein
MRRGFLTSLSGSKLTGAILVSVVLSTPVTINAAPATARSWERPVTVSDDGVRDRLDDFPGFVSSADGRKLALVTLRERKGIVVYPVRRSGRLGRGSFLPGSKDADYPWEDGQAEQAAHGQYPDAAIDDKGLVAVAWQTLGLSGEVGGAFTCNCEIRVDIGAAGRRFSSIVLAPSGRAVLGVQITPAGEVQVLWEADEGQLMLAEIDEPWRSAAERTILPEARTEGATAGQSGEEAFLIEDVGHPEVLVARDTTGLRTVLLVQEPFKVATPTGLSWAPGEVAVEPGWSLLSNGHGLAMAVIADVGRDTLEVATSRGAEASYRFHPVSPLVFGTSGRPSRCGLAGDMNAHGEVLVAWTCYPGESGSEVIRSELLDPEGDVIATSPPDFGWFGNHSEAAVAFDDAGHGVVAREEQPYASIFLDGGHFSHWRPLPHGPNEAQSTVEVGVTTSGVGLASWVEEPSQAEADPTWAGRIQLDRIELP